MKVIMTRGLPASGKTTWAKQQNAYRVNKDDLRSMINNGVWSKKNEKHILSARDALIEVYLADKKDVIVDDTNLSPKHEVKLLELANKYGADFEIKDFCDVPLDECILRDKKRPNYVGEEVIKKMYNQFLRPQPPKIEYNPNLTDCIICDIDGTLALFPGKNPYERDFINDKPNDPVVRILRQFKSNRVITGEPDVFLFSGRNGKFKPATIDWLSKHYINYDHLHMREEGDSRKDSVVKQEMYDSYIKGKYNVLFVIDDRDQVVRLWRSLGLTCFQVADGDF